MGALQGAGVFFSGTGGGFLPLSPPPARLAHATRHPAASLSSRRRRRRRLHNPPMRAFIVLCMLLLPSLALAQERVGVSAVPRHVFDDPSIPGKEFRVLQTTYAPGGQNPRHYHTSHVVFYVLEGAGVWQEEDRPPVTLRAGESLHVRPGTVHAHRNASSTEKLVFLEFVVADKNQRSTVPIR